MSHPEFTSPSPNFSAAPPNERLGVCFHHSVLPFAETITLMRKAESQVSYHCLIGPDGVRCTLVRDDAVAWHAGASTFLGRSRCNDFLLGLAFAGDTYATPLSDDQLASALEWLTPRWTRYGWSLARMTDHRQISTGRKDDLAPAEWSRLRAAIAAQLGP